MKTRCGTDRQVMYRIWVMCSVYENHNAMVPAVKRARQLAKLYPSNVVQVIPVGCGRLRETWHHN